MNTRTSIICCFVVCALGVGQAVAAVSASSATANSVTLDWTAVGDDDNTGTASVYDIRYATFAITTSNWNSASQVTGAPSPQSAGLAESFEVTGLQSGTTYYFAIKVADEMNNWSPLSNVVQQATLQETIPPANIANLAGISGAPNEVTLTWTAPGDDGTTGTAAEYDMRYSTTLLSASNWGSATQVSGEPSPKAAGLTEQFTVSGLSAGFTYYFAVMTADDASNWSGLSNIASVQTQVENTPPADIANLFVTNPSSNSLTLVWSAPGNDGNAGTASQYDIRFSTTNINASNWSSANQLNNEPAPRVAGTAESLVVSGLVTNTKYYFAIMTADEVPNWSGISNVASGTTQLESIPPAAIANLGASDETHNSMRLTWTSPGDDGNSGQASAYSIRYSTAPITSINFGSATEVAGAPAPATAGSIQSFVIDGLEPSTTYYFAIKTADEVPNWSAISNVAARSTTTDQTPPAAIDDLQASTGAGAGEVELGWTAPGNDGAEGQASSYVVRFYNEPITESNWSTALMYTNSPAPAPAGQQQNMQLSGLSPGQLYYFAVKTYDALNNESGISNIASTTAGFILATGEGSAALVSPPPGQVVPSVHPILEVLNEEPQADNVYEFEVCEDSSFLGLSAAGMVVQENGHTTCWKVENPLESDRTYFWRARPMGGEFGLVSHFTVVPQTHAYPNPFSFDEHSQVTFTDLPENADLTLTTTTGEVVMQWSQLTGDELIWDGLADDGSQLSSGMYLWYVDGGSQQGKLVVVR